MVDRLEIGGYIIEFDREATFTGYSHFAPPEPEKCGCWYCRNWAASREQLIPPTVCELLEVLGIPRTGEIEVWEVPGESQPHIYCGWYMLVGKMIARPPAEAREFPLGSWRLWFTEGASYKVDEFAGSEVCELNFQADVGNFLEPVEDP